MQHKFILNLAPTGMIPTKAMTPHVPITADEVVQQLEETVPLGVNMIHLHARDPQTGEPAWQKELYARLIGDVRERWPDLVVCVSCSGRNFPEFERRADVLDLTGDLKPDFASLTLGSVNFNHQVSVSSPQVIQDLASKMKDCGIRPELEVFDTGMVNCAHYLIRKGLVAPPYYFNLILGGIATAQADPLVLGLMLRDLPEDSLWSVGGIGHTQLTANALALAAGGGVRVGLEDNIWFDSERQRLATNRDLTERTVQMAQAMGRVPYGRQDARALLCPPGRGDAR